MMWHVERDGEGVVVGINRGPVYSEGGTRLTDPDPLADDHPEIVAFRNPPPSRADYAEAVKAHLDRAAREREYDGILSLCSYAGDPNPVYAAEAAAGMAWRSTVWAIVAEIEADVRAGLRPAPSPEAVLAELPAMVWPG